MSMMKLISDTARIREEITSKIMFEVMQDEHYDRFDPPNRDAWL